MWHSLQKKHCTFSSGYFDSVSGQCPIAHFSKWEKIGKSILIWCDQIALMAVPPTGPPTCSTSNHSLLTLSFVSFVPTNIESFVFNYLYPCSSSRFTCSPNIVPQGLSNILQHNCASFCNVRKTSNRHISTLQKKLKKSFYCIMWDERVCLCWVMRWEGFPKFRFSVLS